MSTKNHYDVLGIRSNAGREEIELAYKGRRSQYHPDRYAQADADTQRWATACMQEVIAAYDALITGKPQPVPAQESASSAPGPQSKTTLDPPAAFAAAFKTHNVSRAAMSRIYITPRIPLKKLNNALESYGHGISKDDVLGLIDDTMLSSGKDGALLTPSELRTKQAFNPEQVFPLRDLTNLGAKGDSLFINGRKIHRFNITEHHEIALFVQAINDARKEAVRSSGAGDEAASSDISPLLRHATQDYLGEVYASCQREIERQGEADGLDSVRRMGEAAMMLHAVRLSGELPSYAQSSRGSPLSEAELALLLSDAVRVELLLYQMSWIVWALEARYDRSDADMLGDMRRFMTAILYPVLAFVQDNTTPDLHRAFDVIRGTPLHQALEDRLQRLTALFEGPSDDHGAYLFTCLADPIARHARSVACSPGMSITWAAALTDACSPADVRRLVSEMHGSLGNCLSAYRGYIG